MQSRRWRGMDAVGPALLIVAAVLPSAPAQPVEPQFPRALLLTFDPIIESYASQRLHQVGNWNHPFDLTVQYVDDFAACSHGILQYRLTQTIYADMWPIKEDGFRYTDETYLACLATWSGWHQPDARDYKAVARDYDLARKVDSGQFDEVFDHSAPFFGGYETRMLGRGGYWCNSPPQQRIACSKIFIVSVFNYERGVGEMMEDFGHRAESILSYTYSYTTQPDAWYRFALYDLIAPDNAACGNVHFAPNSLSDYDWGNTRYVWSTCEDWLVNFPNLTGQKVWVNCTEWGNGDMRLHHMWWFEHMPHVAGSHTEYGQSRLNNWWEYTQDFNTHPECNGDHAFGQSPPPAQPYTGPQRCLTANIQDDWAPRVSAGGKVVWAGMTGFDYEIYTCNLDGTGLVRITNNTHSDESPEISLTGRVVWQGWDGQDYEIFSANADGTALVQITNNDWDDWHPQINSSNRIVWDGWDGADYEIYSANADGTNVVQITNNNATFPAKPREDVWPQINSAGRVTWMGFDGNDWEIYSANQDGSNLVNVSNNTLEDEYPQINNGNRVVWMTWHSDSNCEIYSSSATGGTPVRLTNNSTEDWWPQINNTTPGQVVWMARTGGDWEIMTVPATGGTAQAVTANGTHDQYPQIDDLGRIAWQGWDGQDWEIYARYDNQIWQITSNTFNDRWPSLDDTDIIVWHADSAPDATGGTSEIWAAGQATADTTAPELLSAAAATATEVRAYFSEPLDPVSAENPANYTIEPPVAVTAAVLQANETTVHLTTAPLTPDVPYTLRVSNVTDQANPPNPIAPNSPAAFTYHVYERVRDGLTVLYDFAEGSGTTVHDVSEVGSPLDLTIQNPAGATWTDGGLVLTSATQISSPGAASKIITACKASNELTVEAWIIPALAEQAGPARIVTVSNNLSARNFTLGHGDAAGNATDMFDVRLRTTETSGNGLPSLTTPAGIAGTSLVHVVFTRAATGDTFIYRDSSVVATGAVGGDFSTWNTAYKLGLGDEFYGTKPWLGEYRLVAVYSRALTGDEVYQNFMAGADPQAHAGLVGDLNCDGDVDFGDINAFVLALSNPGAYAATYPGCPFENRDINGDDVFDFADINAFVALLSQ